VNYQLTLTGSADSTTDVILPISNFTLRWRDSTKDSYLSCTVPSVGKYGNLITARSNGNLVLASGSWELMDCPLTDIRLQRGGNRSSVVLTGYVAVSNPSPQSVTVNEALYSNEDPSGDFRLRVPVQQLLPGDTVTYESVARDIETIALSVNENQAQMELTLV
jgi:hypothetical protein